MIDLKHYGICNPLFVKVSNCHAIAEGSGQDLEYFERPLCSSRPIQQLIELIRSGRLLILMLVLMPMLLLANEDELLPPEQAFDLSVEHAGGDQINLNWTIAQGYYLYREKLKLDIDGKIFEYGDLTLPQGTLIDDPLFGEVTIYKNSLTFQLPATDTPPSALTVTSQGCNEPVGICYPPQTEKFDLIAQTRASDTQSAARTAIFSQGTVFGSSTEEDFLPVDEAFQFVLTKTDTNRIVANFEATKGYYLYKPHIKFKSENPDIVISEIEYPQGIIKDDPHFGEIEVYYGTATIPINIARRTNTNDLRLTAEYQGCAEDGICYPPQTRTLELTLADYEGPFAENNALAVQDDSGKSVVWYLLAAFGGGLLLTFTPCVLPMIPILSGIIMAERDKGGLNHSGLLSLIYVLGTAASYTLIGAVAGATGEQLQAYFQTPLAIGILSGLLLLMALSMFGLYKLQVPAFMQTTLSGHSQRLASGGVISIFAMGMFSALIVGACVSPLLISTLGIAIAKGSAILGGALMFCMAMGMGVVLIIFGFEFGHLMPKAGNWMIVINRIIGLLLIAAAIYLLGFLPGVPVLLLWSLLLIGAAIYLYYLVLPTSITGLAIMTKTLSVVLICWGVMALVGGFNGYRDILNPLPLKDLISNDPDRQSAQARFTVVSSLEEVDSLFAAAKKQNKHVLLDYYADWCLDCLRMDGTTFQEPEVVSTLGKDFITVKVDITDAADERVRAVKKYFNVYGPPATLFFDSDGNELDKFKFYGYKNSDELLQILNSIIGQS